MGVSGLGPDEGMTSAACRQNMWSPGQRKIATLALRPSNQSRAQEEAKPTDRRRRKKEERYTRPIITIDIRAPVT